MTFRSDYNLPGCDGVAALKHARPARRVLDMSGCAGDAVRHVLLVEGTPFLQKPLTPHALSLRVREVLDAR